MVDVVDCIEEVDVWAELVEVELLLVPGDEVVGFESEGRYRNATPPAMTTRTTTATPATTLLTPARFILPAT